LSSLSGKQTGDPAKLAVAIVQLASSETPPARFIAGADAAEATENKAKVLLEQVNAYRSLSSSLAHDEA
jgi:hypothetical protein